MNDNCIVVGLGYGDEGKGSIVDFLARRENVSQVIRYNGGPQAAHHVVLPGGAYSLFLPIWCRNFGGNQNRSFTIYANRSFSFGGRGRATSRQSL